MAETVLTSSSFELLETVDEEDAEEQQQHRQFIECRVCLQNSNETGCPLSAAVVIDSDKEHFLALQDIFTQICAVEIAANDGLPDVICDDCRDILMAAYKLQLTAQSSDAVLRERKSRPFCMTPAGARQKRVVLDNALEQGEWKDDGVGQQQHAAEDDSEEHLFDDLVEQEDADGCVELLVAKSKRTGSGVPRQYPECETCGKQFTKAYYLNRHKEVHVMDPNRPFQCPVCYKRFHIESTLKVHVMVHDQSLVEEHTTQIMDALPVIYRCQECSAEFQSSDAFDEHWKMHSEDTDVEVVEGQGQGEDELEMPPPSRPPAKEYRCEYCSKIYHNLNLFARHAKAMHPERATHQCNICELVFPLGSLLNEHLQQHQGIKRFACTDCDKSFRLAGSLRDHQRSHDNDRAYLCTECGKGFHSRSNLRQHMMRHSDDKKYACDECPSRFVTKSSLTSHRRIHTGAKPYQCSECDAAFNTHFSWSKHKRTHSGEKPYVCEVCGMRFNSSYHVTRHLRTHTGEKPYKCPYCDRAFAQSNDLVKHKRSHLGRNTYQCTECPDTFRLHSELRLHTQQHFLEKKNSSGGGGGQESILLQEELVEEEHVEQEIEIEMQS